MRTLHTVQQEIYMLVASYGGLMTDAPQEDKDLLTDLVREKISLERSERSTQ